MGNQEKKKKGTLVTISENTGFSVSTVSRVLNGKAKRYRISDKTIELIKIEAKRSNYRPSLLAKGLRTNKTHTIGLIVPGIENPYFSLISSIVIQRAKIFGYTCILADSMEDQVMEQEVINSMLSRQVDGIIIVPCGDDPKYLEEVDQDEVPLILIDRYFVDTTLSYVTTNNYEGGYEATKHLIDNGHVDILSIGGVPHSMPSQERSRGYKSAMTEARLEGKIKVVGTDFTINNGYIETKLALSRKEKPTAIFANSNTILLGTLKAVRESKMRIPKDISIVSFDNNVYLDYLDPAITRMEQPTEKICTLAIKLLMDRLESGANEQSNIELSPNLIVRNSVSNIK